MVPVCCVGQMEAFSQPTAAVVLCCGGSLAVVRLCLFRLFGRTTRAGGGDPCWEVAGGLVSFVKSPIEIEIALEDGINLQFSGPD
jgi:hypothetical protein